MRIHILQLATPNIDEYAIYSIASMYKLCQCNNIGFSVQRERLLDTLHINWTKIELLKATLGKNTQNADFIILVDADTVVINPSFDLPRFLNGFLEEETHILMPQDNPTNPFNRNRPNAGFIVVKNSDKGKEIIHDWLIAAQGSCAHLNDTHPRNQLVFWNCVWPKYRENLELFPLKYFHKKSSKAFMHHFMKRKGDLRKRKMEKMFSKTYPHQLLTEVEKKLTQTTDQITFLTAK